MSSINTLRFLIKFSPQKTKCTYPFGRCDMDATHIVTLNMPKFEMESWDDPKSYQKQDFAVCEECEKESKRLKSKIGPPIYHDSIEV